MSRYYLFLGREITQMAAWVDLNHFTKELLSGADPGGGGHGVSNLPLLSSTARNNSKVVIIKKNFLTIDLSFCPDSTTPGPPSPLYLKSWIRPWILDSNLRSTHNIYIQTHTHTYGVFHTPTEHNNVMYIIYHIHFSTVVPVYSEAVGLGSGRIIKSSVLSLVSGNQLLNINSYKS